MPRFPGMRFILSALTLMAVALPTFAWELGPLLPGPRKDAAIVADGNRILLLGGRTTGNALLASCHALDTATGAWSPLAPMPEPRSNAAYVRIGDNVFVFGGHTPNETATALRYHIPTDTWFAIAPMPAANSGMACAAVAGAAYVFGGGHDGAPRNVAWRYDPATDSWSTLPALPHARKSPVAVALEGAIHVIGGHTAASGVNDATIWVDVYTPASGVWTTAPNLPIALTAGAATVRDGRIWLAGGIDGLPTYGKFAHVWSYRPGEPAWSAENPFPDGLGGAVAVTTDATTIFVLGGSDAIVEGVTTVYRQFLNEPDIVLVRDVPNDQGGKVSIRWIASLLDRGLGSPVGAYWIWREVPVAAALRAIDAGGRMLAAGERPSRVAARQFRTTASATEFVYWEYVGSQIAHAFPAYSYTTPTLFDSLPGSNPQTRFMVEAEDLATGEYWQSSPVSGYSVDNLAPPAPGPLAYRFTESGLVLSWLPSEAPDLAGYRVYFGATADFEADDASRLATVTDTSYAATLEGAGFYKVRGLDVHGNEGPAVMLQNVLAVGDGLSSGLALASPVPNPASGPARIRYTLGRAGHVRLALYDVGGRECRVLASGMQSAGEHAMVFALDDGRGSRLGAGIYFLKLESEGKAVTKRLAILQ